MIVDLYPAIDLRDGRCVRLVQGDYDRETRYDGDPVEVARTFAAAGAPWIHVVDLDGARTGTAHQRQVISAIATSVRVPVQTGGGVRSGTDVDELLGLGVSRVVMGTVAVEDPKLVVHLAKRHPGKIVIGLDQRDGHVALRGWEERTTITVADAFAPYVDVPVASLVVTDIGVDGMLEGPDVDTYKALADATPVPVIASGGVGTLDHIRALTSTGVAGVIVGKAIYEGVFDVRDAVEAAA